MAKTIDEIREEKAKKFVTGLKDEFKKFIPRDKIKNVEITGCVNKGDAFELSGAVGTKSPTKKDKTFRYVALVAVDAEGACTLSDLKVSEL